VVIYGQPSPAIQKFAFSERTVYGKRFGILELNRLIVETPIKNAASFLIGNSLKLLPKPCAVVSYADTAMGHCGRVYQATNWLYTGSTISHDKLYALPEHLAKFKGEIVHSLTIQDRFNTNSPTKFAKENGIELITPQPKHRYFYFLGTAAEKRKLRGFLKYPPVLEYPKSTPTRYDLPKFEDDFWI
jgi:hypothetical protein